MAVLALTFALVSFQATLESKIEKQLAPFTYKTLPVEKTAEGLKLIFRRETPIYNFGAQGAGSGGGGREAPKPSGFLKDENTFLLTEKPLKVSWPESKNHSTTREAFLGKLDGKYVYAQGPINEIAYVAKGLPFQGGSDWRDLAAIGLGLQDREFRGVSSVYFFSRTGDSSIPFLLKALGKRPKVVGGLILAIAESTGPGSIPAIQKLYRSKNPEIVRGAAYALISSPRKTEARKELLDMLEKGLYVQYAAPVAAENSWIEAVPILQKIKVDANRFFDLVAVMQAERALRPSTIHITKEAFARVLQGQDPEDKYLKLLIEDPDKEMAAAYGLALRGSVSKGNTSPANEAGDIILKMLPKEAVEAVKARFKS